MAGLIFRSFFEKENPMFRRMSFIGLFVLAALFAGPVVESAQACPNCKEGIKSDDQMPRAYQYSIIFMLTVPATIFTGFSYTFYRLSQQNAAKQQSLDPEVLAQYDERVITALKQNDQE
ncbi:hypothetical protein CA54_47900 [Symmachiella macrocystis]|uniref:Uncharacterized protein n=2 Tax=Symmachiella macrocystis TaxID=2527985 RepID=A0A5C6BC20_9PLAN|nr:hypothetical protein CA54_47900 [Symmachiella macrocystis]